MVNFREIQGVSRIYGQALSMVSPIDALSHVPPNEFRDFARLRQHSDLAAGTGRAEKGRATKMVIGNGQSLRDIFRSQVHAVLTGCQPPCDPHRRGQNQGEVLKSIAQRQAIKSQPAEMQPLDLHTEVACPNLLTFLRHTEGLFEGLERHSSKHPLQWRDQAGSTRKSYGRAKQFPAANPAGHQIGCCVFPGIPSRQLTE